MTESKSYLSFSVFSFFGSAIGPQLLLLPRLLLPLLLLLLLLPFLNLFFFLLSFLFFSFLFFSCFCFWRETMDHHHPRHCGPFRTSLVGWPFPMLFSIKSLLFLDDFIASLLDLLLLKALKARLSTLVCCLLWLGADVDLRDPRSGFTPLRSAPPLFAAPCYLL